MKTTIGTLVLLFGLASPALAQDGISIRPFFLGMQQQFAARDSFDTIFRQTAFPMWGGGADVTFGGWFVEVNASRFKRTGERAFRFNDEVFRLGIDDTVTITPLEVLGGVRIRRWRRYIPYLGGGVGTYRLQEESEFSSRDEEIDQRRVGFAAVGGVEIRAHRLVGIGVDAHYSRVTGLIGKEGVLTAVSTQVEEDNLGGIAARFKIMIGR